ncbi:MAG TPA: amidase family protein [Kiloniellaceae bacterium]|nr:amidase family protein [Kiloniellaceae bacterium]
MTEELCDKTALELREMIAGKAISPVELYRACEQRIDRVNPVVNAIVARDEAGGLAAAQAAEAQVMRGGPLGPLHGLPVGIKDLAETAGLRTTFGSRIYSDHVPEKDEPLVAAIRNAGAIVSCKTNTPEFGAGANTWNSVYGATGNPFDPALTCSGSSGGSAVALACGMVPLATGSDLGGSLRTPAGYCGVVGFRPTPGLVGDPTRLLAWNPLSVEGPMARCVADLRLLLSVMAAPRTGCPLSFGQRFPSQPEDGAQDLSGLRVAFSEDLGFAPVAREVRAAFRERAAAIAPFFAAAEDVDPPLEDADRIFEVLRAVGFLAAHRGAYEAHPELLGPNVTANVELGLTYSAVDVADAARDHSALYRRFIAFMVHHDLLICPVAAVQPFPKEELYPTAIDGEKLATYVSWIGITYGLTLTGHPVAVLPCGLDAQGMPFGLQLVGRYGQDLALLAIAEALEAALAATDYRRPLPDLAALAAAD